MGVDNFSKGGIMLDELFRQVLGMDVRGKKQKKGGGGGGTHHHYHIHNKIGNTYRHKSEYVKKKDVYKFITNHIHKK